MCIRDRNNAKAGTMKGKIIKGIAGFYYVHAGDALHSTDGIYECKAKGVFRKAVSYTHLPQMEIRRRKAV